MTVNGSVDTRQFVALFLNKMDCMDGDFGNLCKFRWVIVAAFQAFAQMHVKSMKCLLFFSFFPLKIGEFHFRNLALPTIKILAP